jgi:hypothetical protein
MRVISVREDGAVIVDGRGYRRIVGQPDGRALVEFVRVAYAAKIVANYNWCFPDGERWAEAVSYREVYRRQHASDPTAA